ncbi:helix-turn-helix domain-containing protein [Salmonella enterica subsp. houtenae serovar 43:z4,z23:-]|nr:helix-turn-helix domain-containing protein [Salmonella enterica subsp. houtenae serovar Houten]
MARSKGSIGGRRQKLTPEQWDQARRLIGAGVPRQKVAIIYDVGLSTLYRKFPANKSWSYSGVVIEARFGDFDDCPL